MKTTNVKKLTVAAVMCAVAVVGSLFSFPVVLLMGQGAGDVAFYAYIIPPLISTAAGAILSGILIYSLNKTKVLSDMQAQMK